MKIEFIDYKPTPDQKCLGIASVMIHLEEVKIMLRYKVQSGKDGRGQFYSPAAHRMDESTYIPSFIIDSNIMSESIKDAIKHGLKNVSSSTHQTASSSQSNGYRAALPSSDYGEVPF